jgi:hypothetical protein
VRSHCTPIKITVIITHRAGRDPILIEQVEIVKADVISIYLKVDLV